jgi:hypothetical protein
VKGDMAFSLLSLGTRRDANKFCKGATEKPLQSARAIVNAPKPPLDDIKKLFRAYRRRPFLCRHFAGALYNEDHSVDHRAFETNTLRLQYDGQTTVLNRGAKFNKPVASS